MAAALALLTAAACFLPACKKPAEEEAKRDTSGKYLLNADGEAVIDDIVFNTEYVTDDNNRVFYEIFVGSFSDSNGDGSGESLGVEGIWLTPIFKSSSYHKYNVADYYAIDPAFGTMEDLIELIALCHARNVKLIIDLPINHTSNLHAWFGEFTKAHRQNDTESKYYDYYCYYSYGEDKPAGKSFSQLSGTDIYYESNFSGDMPELNFDNADVREDMLAVAKFYMDLGIDGFRFDAAKYIYFGDNGRSVDFWTWYIGELRKIDPDVYTVAEVWDSDAITDLYYPVTNCFNFTIASQSGLIAQTAMNGNAGKLAGYIQSYLGKVQSMRKDAMPALFVANHDTDRCAGYLTVASGNMSMAASLYILSPGTPFIYYGEEIGLRGSRGGDSTDANRRLAMLWGDGDTVKDPIGSTYPAINQTNGSVKEQIGNGDSLLSHYKKLLMIRKANPEIARGTYEAVTLANLGGFISTWQGSSVLVLFNTGNGEKTVDLSAVGNGTFSVIAAVAGVETASLDGTTLTVGGKTTVVLRTSG